MHGFNLIIDQAILACGLTVNIKSFNAFSYHFCLFMKCVFIMVVYGIRHHHACAYIMSIEVTKLTFHLITVH